MLAPYQETLVELEAMLYITTAFPLDIWIVDRLEPSGRRIFHPPDRPA